jgi:hypothetical protein
MSKEPGEEGSRADRKRTLKPVPSGHGTAYSYLGTPGKLPPAIPTPAVLPAGMDVTEASMP